MSFTNNASSTLASSITTVATSLTVASGQGSLFPTLSGSQYFYCTLENTAGTSREIVKVTARSTDTFTIVRGQDGTTGIAFAGGDKVELRLVAAELNNFPKLDEANTFTGANAYGTPASITLTNATGLPNSGLVNNSVTVTAGTGLSGGGAVALGGSTTLTNAGVTSIAAGTGISVSGSTGAVTVTNTATSSYVGGKGQVFTANGTFTIPAGVTAVKVTLVGGGGGGRGSSSNGGAGGTTSVASGTQTITTISGVGGAGGTNLGAVAGGTASGGDINITGGKGVGVGGSVSCTSFAASAGGSAGGNDGFATVILGGTGTYNSLSYSSTGILGGRAGAYGIVASGYGNGGGATTADPNPNTGGGGGGYAQKFLTGLTSGNTLAVTIGSAGTAGGGTYSGSVGTPGIVIIEW